MLIKGAEVVVVDEAHEMRNPTSVICKALSQVSASRRIALTGYPLQNNLVGEGRLCVGCGRRVTAHGGDPQLCAAATLRSPATCCRANLVGDVKHAEGDS